MIRIKNIGIGTDIEDIGRFRKFDLLKNSLFLKKIFTKNELTYCFSQGKTASHLAVRYAGKEAVAKAINSIENQAINFKDIEILNNKAGAPLVKIRDSKFKKLQINISLSHCRGHATAFAIAIRRGYWCAQP